MKNVPEKVIIHTDGLSRNNPGQAAIGATIKDENGRLLAAISRRIGIATNNQAEYLAAITAVKKAIELGARHAELYMDSQLVVKQVCGQYRVKNAGIKPRLEELKTLLGSLESYAITYVPRELNTEADGLANKAMDSAAHLE